MTRYHRPGTPIVDDGLAGRGVPQSESTKWLGALPGAFDAVPIGINRPVAGAVRRDSIPWQAIGRLLGRRTDRYL